LYAEGFTPDGTAVALRLNAALMAGFAAAVPAAAAVALMPGAAGVDVPALYAGLGVLVPTAAEGATVAGLSASVAWLVFTPVLLGVATIPAVSAAADAGLA
jgi:hypothetical protein